MNTAPWSAAKPGPASASIFGNMLGIVVLGLSLLAIALPIFAAFYLDQFRLGASAPPPRLVAAKPVAAVAPPPAVGLAEAPPSPLPAPVTTAAAAPEASAALPAGAARRAVIANSDQVVDIAFLQGSAKLANERKSELGEIAAVYHKHGGTVRIVGYGEAAAEPGAAYGLALERAKTVALLLSQLGISPGDLRVEAAPSPSDAPPGGAGAEVFIFRS